MTKEKKQRTRSLEEQALQNPSPSPHHPPSFPTHSIPSFINRAAKRTSWPVRQIGRQRRNFNHLDVTGGDRRLPNHRVPHLPLRDHPLGSDRARGRNKRTRRDRLPLDPPRNRRPLHPRLQIQEPERGRQVQVCSFFEVLIFFFGWNFFLWLEYFFLDQRYFF